MTAYGPLQSSLDAATATGAGTVVDLGVPQDDFLVYYVVAGSGSATFKLEASLDGTNWYESDAFNASAGAAFASALPNTASGGIGRYFQATLQSVSGSPVVTVAIAAAVH